MHVCVEHIKDGAEGEQGKESSAPKAPKVFLAIPEQVWDPSPKAPPLMSDHQHTRPGPWGVASAIRRIPFFPLWTHSTEDCLTGLCRF